MKLSPAVAIGYPTDDLDGSQLRPLGRCLNGIVRLEDVRNRAREDVGALKLEQERQCSAGLRKIRHQDRAGRAVTEPLEGPPMPALKGSS